MNSTMNKPVIFDKDGNPLSVVPGTEKPASFDEMEEQWEAIRRRHGPLLAKLSLDDIIREKRAEASRE